MLNVFYRAHAFFSMEISLGQIKTYTSIFNSCMQRKNADVTFPIAIIATNQNEYTNPMKMTLRKIIK